MKFALLICITFALLLGLIFLFLLLQRKFIPEETKPQTVQQPPVSAEEYCRVGEVLISCIAANFARLGLCRPSELPQHMLPWPQGVRTMGNTVVLVYLFDRMADLTISNGGEMQPHYSTVDVDTMKRTLNSVLPNYGIANGLYPLKVVDVKSLKNGRIAIAITPV